MEDAIHIAKELNADLSKFSLSDFLRGINIEKEHGLINPKTNVTNDDPYLTGKIALAHLNEFSNYYNKDYGLQIFEKFLKTKLLKKQ